ncbi:hypothetical protein L1987_19006 [Smallanthus sonchifolius]|uniref:Uncharacterized protein n=1 Tax=Smallanthus sonchifolius TaxID=185202 RepID=A0ACB9J3D0_9ASTR|nr:hypothetical protein L1987_19006 [Smallanthus sonchifolius]
MVKLLEKQKEPLWMLSKLTLSELITCKTTPTTTLTISDGGTIRISADRITTTKYNLVLDNNNFNKDNLRTFSIVNNFKELTSQIAKLLSERQPGCLPSNTETNPKANVSAITLKNSKVYPDPQMPKEEEVQTASPKEIFTGVPLRPPTIESTTQDLLSKETSQPIPMNTPIKTSTRAKVCTPENMPPTEGTK